MKEFFRSIWDSQTFFARVLRATFQGAGVALATKQAGGDDASAAIAGAVTAIGGIIPAGEMNPQPAGR